jgi:L,D-transpeptidase YcbB
MRRIMLRGGCAAAGLAIGLLTATGAWAETPVPEQPAVTAAPAEVATPAETDRPLEPAVAEVLEGAPAAEPAPVEERGAVVEAVPAEPAIAPEPVVEAAAESGASAQPIAEQLALLMGPEVPDSAFVDFYASRDFAPAWVEATGLNANGEALVAALENAADDGLRPQRYLNDPILSRMDAADPFARAELDLLLSDAFVRFGNDLMNGRFRQGEQSLEVRDYESTMDLTQPLRYAVESGQVAETLQGMAPPHPQYASLRAALAEYRALVAAGGWPAVPDTGQSLEQGQRSAAISALRARMAASGDYVLPTDGQVDDTYYDAALAEAVKEFQRDHGLLDDAVVGPRTLAALNAGVEYRVQQIEAAMERWRWYPRDLGSKYVMVNVPQFELRAVDGDAPPMAMRVVVGTPEHQTPIFNDRMEYSQLNPYWNVPQSIADNEYLPALRDDPFHLLNQNIRILSGGEEINPVLVDWSSIGGRFPYVLRQEPGSGNALGRIKFLFPNRHSVYMHDTPQRHLFERSARSFSHGCIRLQDPMAMAGFVFNGQYTVEEVEELIASGRTRDLILDESIPVYIAYFTAGIGDDGAVSFYNDLYGRERVLIEAMDGAVAEVPEVVAENVAPQGLN